MKSMRDVVIGGRRFAISGEAGDPYFDDAQTHVGGYADLERIAGRLRNGAVVFDVGANIGLSAMLMATLNPGLTIHAFEPSPMNFEHLTRNVAQIGGDQIRLHRQAASDRRGTLSFREVGPAQGGSGGWSHVVASDPGRPGDGTVAVPAVPLDDFADLAPDFIKIDVEGHEPEVIAGAPELLARHAPLLHMEFNPWTLCAHGKHSLAAFAEALFRCFDVEDGPAGAEELMHRTIGHGTMMDLVMRPKRPFPRPTLAELAFPPAAVRQIGLLATAG